MSKLVIKRAGVPDDTHELDGAGEVVIGRGSAAGLRISDPKLSRTHCKVFQDHGGWLLEDMGSSNGTKVNGRTLKRHALKGGDRIEIGLTVIVFKAAPRKALSTPKRTSARDRLTARRKKR